MLKDLFGENPRQRILFLFYRHPDTRYTDDQIIAKIRSTKKVVTRELRYLVRNGILLEHLPPKSEKGGSPAYDINPDYALYQEFRALFLKEEFQLQSALAEQLRQLKGLKLLLLTGVFVDDPEARTDILVVGNVSKDRFLQILQRMQRRFGKTLHYTLLTEAEYRYRMEVTDRFLYDILSGQQLTVFNALKQADEDR